MNNSREHIDSSTLAAMIDAIHYQRTDIAGKARARRVVLALREDGVSKSFHDDARAEAFDLLREFYGQ